MSRCDHLAQEHETLTILTKMYGKGFRMRLWACGRVPAHCLRRRRGNQGPGYVAGVSRKALKEWFVKISSAVAGHVLPKIVLAHPQQLASVFVREMKPAGSFIRMAVVDKGWPSSLAARRWSLLPQLKRTFNR